MAISELPKFSNSFRAGNPVTRVKGDRPKALAEVHRLLLFLQALIPAFDLNIHESQTRRLLGIQLTQNKTYKGKVIKTYHSSAFQDEWQGGSSRVQFNTHLGRHLPLNEMIIIHDNVNVCRDTWLVWSHHMPVGKWSLFCVIWLGNHCTEPAPAKATILIPERWFLQVPTLAGHWWWRDTILQLATVCV